MLRNAYVKDGVGAIVRGCVWSLFVSVAVVGHSRAADDSPGGSPELGRGHTEPATRHQGVKRFEIGQGPKSYLIFEPDKPKPEEKAPVVVFLHGWFAVNPGFYGAWIDHLVRDGKDRRIPPLPERRGHYAAGLLA